ncbi:MAG TPA: PAS domain-containing protein, partial [Candidatus Bathyarchaeia archaeon]|nr:PAS domain-containing protein [Candidatus Bathyarchaeia archaeon]
EAGFIGDEEQGLLENLVRELELALQSMAAEEQRYADDLALKASEEKYRMMVENLNDIIYIGDEAGNISFINPAVERILGYSPQEIIGRNILDLVHPEDAAAARQRRGLMVEGKAGPW